MTIHANRYCVQGVAITVVGEIDTMACGTIASSRRHGNGLAINNLQSAVNLMAGGAGIMNFRVITIDCNSSSSTSGQIMTAYATCICPNSDDMVSNN